VVAVEQSGGCSHSWAALPLWLRVGFGGKKRWQNPPKNGRNVANSFEILVEIVGKVWLFYESTVEIAKPVGRLC